MNNQQPYIIDITDTPINNNSDSVDGETFEFSQNNIWNNSFLSPEMSNDKLFDDIKIELHQIHILIGDIKNLLQSLFETK